MYHLQKEIRKALQLLDFLEISMKKRPCYRSLVYGGGQRSVNLPRPLKLLWFSKHDAALSLILTLMRSVVFVMIQTY